MQVVNDEFARLLGRVFTLACITAKETLGSGEERPAPAVFLSMLVARVDKILGHDAALHLQAGDIGVEATAHFGPGEATHGTQLTRDEAAVFLQREQDGFFNRTRCWF